MLVVSIEPLDISLERNFQMESHLLAEKETKNVIDQQKYNDTKYMLGTVLDMEDNRDESYSNLVFKMLRV